MVSRVLKMSMTTKLLRAWFHSWLGFFIRFAPLGGGPGGQAFEPAGGFAEGGLLVGQIREGEGSGKQRTGLVTDRHNARKPNARHARLAAGEGDLADALAHERLSVEGAFPGQDQLSAPDPV